MNRLFLITSSASVSPANDDMDTGYPPQSDHMLMTCTTLSPISLSLLEVDNEYGKQNFAQPLAPILYSHGERMHRVLDYVHNAFLETG